MKKPIWIRKFCMRIGVINTDVIPWIICDILNPKSETTVNVIWWPFTKIETTLLQPIFNFGYKGSIEEKADAAEERMCTAMNRYSDETPLE